MKIKFIERWKFSLSGRSVPVIRAEDITHQGLIGALHLVGNVKKRPNSLVNTWDSKGWEIDPYSQKITLIHENGNSESVYVVSESGKTINLYTDPVMHPNLEDVIGHAATMDDIGDSMDLAKSMRNIAIGLLFGIGLGAFIIGPIITGLLK